MVVAAIMVVAIVVVVAVVVAAVVAVAIVVVTVGSGVRPFDGQTGPPGRARRIVCELEQVLKIT